MPLRRYLSLLRLYRAKDKSVDQVWRALLTDDYPPLRYGRRLIGLLPSARRCKNCSAPFDGITAPLFRLVGRGPFERNPRFCGW